MLILTRKTNQIIVIKNLCVISPLFIDTSEEAYYNKCEIFIHKFNSEFVDKYLDKLNDGFDIEKWICRIYKEQDRGIITKLEIEHKDQNKIFSIERGESIRVSDKISIKLLTFCKYKGRYTGQVSLGIQSPKEYKIYRPNFEIHDQISIFNSMDSIFAI